MIINENNVSAGSFAHRGKPADCVGVCPGFDLGDKLFSNHLKECAILCQTNESCSHWTWSMHDEDWGKYCWLKFSDEGWKPGPGQETNDTQMSQGDQNKHKLVYNDFRNI